MAWIVLLDMRLAPNHCKEGVRCGRALHNAHMSAYWGMHILRNVGAFLLVLRNMVALCCNGPPPAKSICFISSQQG